eukprot:4756908-Karenia_brevis.AAC.1
MGVPQFFVWHVALLSICAGFHRRTTLLTSLPGDLFIMVLQSSHPMRRQLAWERMQRASGRLSVGESDKVNTLSRPQRLHPEKVKTSSMKRSSGRQSSQKVKGGA